MSNDSYRQESSELIREADRVIGAALGGALLGGSLFSGTGAILGGLIGAILGGARNEELRKIEDKKHHG